MSHELRTPLNAIIGFSELIHGELFGALENEKYKEYSGDILDSGQHLLGLVNNLLYFSQLSAGKVALNQNDLDPDVLLKDAANTHEIISRRAEVEIIVDAADNPILIADQNGVMRMLLALLDNAVKFSKPGGKVYLKAQRREDGACEISIRDTGMGIPKAELGAIFTPFRKGQESEQNARPGTGMGLAMAKIMMDLHGGSIAIDSVKGKGTSVTLVFPAHASAHTDVCAAQ